MVKRIKPFEIKSQTLQGVVADVINGDRPMPKDRVIRAQRLDETGYDVLVFWRILIPSEFINEMFWELEHAQATLETTYSKVGIPDDALICEVRTRLHRGSTHL